MNKQLGILNFSVAPDANGGEQVSICTIFLEDVDGRVFLNTEISLQSYGNSCALFLCDAALTPEILRDLANKIESKKNIYSNKP